MDKAALAFVAFVRLEELKPLLHRFVLAKISDCYLISVFWIFGNLLQMWETANFLDVGIRPYESEALRLLRATGKSPLWSILIVNFPNI